MLLQLGRTKQKGFGLLELMLSMVIVALLLLMVTNYYRSSRNAARIQQAVNMIQQAYSAAENLANATGSYTGIKVESVLPFLPNQSAKSPWPGADDLKVASGASTEGGASDLLVVSIGTADNACQNLADAFKGIASAECNGKVASVTFKHN